MLDKLKNYLLNEIPLWRYYNILTACILAAVVAVLLKFDVLHSICHYLLWDVPLYRYYNIVNACVFTAVVTWFFTYRRKDGLINNRLGIKWLLCLHYMEHAMYHGLSFMVLGFGVKIAKYSSIESEGGEECIIVKEEPWFLTSFFHADKSWDGQCCHKEFTFAYFCLGRKTQVFFNLTWTSPFKTDA